MNLHYLIVSGTHIASPYLSSDIELLYGCYVVYDVIKICQLLRHSKCDCCSVISQDTLKEVHSYPLSFKMKAGVDVLSWTSLIHIFLLPRHA